MGGVWLSQDERLKKTGVAGIEAHSKRIKKQLDMTLCHHVMSNVFFFPTTECAASWPIPGSHKFLVIKFLLSLWTAA